MQLRASPPLKVPVYVLYCLSGLVSLVYQVAWFRIFVDRFGSTNLTFVLVITNFIGGLGLGALLSRWCVNRISSVARVRNPLRIYGILELLVAATALLTLLLDAIPSDLWGTFPYELRDGIYQQTFGYRLSKGFIITVCVLAPSLFMGMTFPLLCRTFESDERFPSALYAWNTLGACSGILLFELLLTTKYGHSQAFTMAIAANMAIGCFFVVAGRVRLESESESDVEVAKSNRIADLTPANASVLITCAIVAGFVTGAIEADVFKHVRYTTFRSAAAMPFISFWAILAIFLAATTVRMLRGLRLRTISIAYVVAVGYYALVWRYTYQLEDWILDLQGQPMSIAMASDRVQFMDMYLRHSGPEGLLLFIGLTVFPAFFVFSLALPYVCNRLQGSHQHLGRVYGLNTVAFCAGMVIFSWIAPMVNAFYSFKLVLLTLVVGTTLMLGLREERRLGVWKPALAAVALIASVFFSPRGFDRSFFQATNPAATQEIRALRSNGDTTTFVVEDASGSNLYFDNFNMSGTAIPGQRYMRLMSHFPLLVQSDPKTAAVICFGVGNTASAIARHDGIERIDIIDLNDQVFKTAPEFRRTNFRVYEDPRVRLIHDDGRNFMDLTEESYDLVTSEPPPPMLEGVYRLYSLEYYESVKERLTPTGVMTQWLPLRQMPRESVQLAVSTFIAAFPNALLFVGDQYDFIMMGSKTAIDLQTMEKRFFDQPKVGDDLASVHVFTPVNLLARIVKSDQQLREEYGGLPVISDQRRDWDYAVFNLENLAQISYDPIAMLEHLDAERLENGGLFRRVVTHFGKLRSFVQDFPLGTLLSVDAEAAGEIEFASADWNRIYELNRRAYDLAKEGHRHEAIALYRESLEVAGGQQHILRTVALLYSDVLDFRASAKMWRDFIDLTRDEPDGYFNLGRVLFQDGQRDEAIEAWRAASARSLTDTEWQKALGRTFLIAEQWDAALRAADRVLAMSPDDPEALELRHQVLAARSQ